MHRRPRLAPTAAIALALGTPACSLVFPADELANGAAASADAGADAAGGSGGTTSSCNGAAQCDDGDPCTADDCGNGTCSHLPTPGATCGEGTDCTPAPSCSAEGSCVPGTPDDAACDDTEECTIDACSVLGCTHQPATGAPCNDGNVCDAAGTCNGVGVCIAEPVAGTVVCAGQAECPGGFFKASFYCEPFCGDCPFCINAATCAFACTPTLTACCGNDCATACPGGYHIVAGPVKLPECGCGDAAPGDSVTCSL